MRIMITRIVISVKYRVFGSPFKKYFQNAIKKYEGLERRPEAGRLIDIIV